MQSRFDKLKSDFNQKIGSSVLRKPGRPRKQDQSIVADIGLGNSASIRDKYSTNIYVRLGYEELEQAGTNGETALPATESISKLNIVCTQLFELR